MTAPTIAVAGATGDLGTRIASALVRRGAQVRALVRPGTTRGDLDRVTSLGAAPVPADPADVDALATAVTGSACVVSALNGLRDVVLDRQSLLLDAAVRAGVPRFVPSDYSSDYTRTIPGQNRNLDLRREFAGRADRASIAVTSVLGGAFMDMVGREMPILLPRFDRVLHVGDADQPIDLTTKDDVAAFTAAVAMDPSTPRYLRVAGDVVSARDIAAVMADVTGRPHRTLRVGGIGLLSTAIAIGRTLSPQPGEVFPPWQGMQYMRDSFSGRGKLDPLDSGRYPDLRLTSLREHLSARG